MCFWGGLLAACTRLAERAMIYSAATNYYPNKEAIIAWNRIALIQMVKMNVTAVANILPSSFPYVLLAPPTSPKYYHNVGVNSIYNKYYLALI